MKKLFVFDLDFTLWDTGGMWCDCTTPPYHKSNGKVYDSRKNHLKLYSETLEILEDLKSEGKILAVASRTSQPSWAKELMQLFEIDHFFSYKEIYPTSKIKHLTKISNESGCLFSEMVFFDDEYRNIDDAQSIGVSAQFVRNGINKELIEKYLKSEF